MPTIRPESETLFETLTTLGAKRWPVEFGKSIRIEDGKAHEMEAQCSQTFLRISNTLNQAPVCPQCCAEDVATFVVCPVDQGPKPSNANTIPTVLSDDGLG